MQAKKIFTTTVFLILQPLTALAEINALDGSFRYQIKLPEFHLTLNYNSRSLYQGIFGLGWCADFEKSNCTSNGPKSPTPSLPPHLKFQIKNGLLTSLQGGSQNLVFKYDEKSNLSIIHDLTRHQIQMIRYDTQDRIISYHHQNLCFDQIQYRQLAQNLFMTQVLRSCPLKPKEKIQYVFKVSAARKRQRYISSIEVTRSIDEKSKATKTQRLSEIP